MRKVTIEDISRHTGLSRGTVSRALNDRPDISVETKQRVLAACQELKYVPSHAARSLATGRNYAVAVVLDDLHKGFSADYLRGVLRRAERDHYGVYVIELSDEPDAAAEQIRMGLVTERIDSVLLAARLPTGVADVLHEALGSHPLAASAAIPRISCDIFAPDAAEAGRLAARHLLDQGYRKLAYVQRANHPTASESWNGFQEVCQERGVRPDGLTIKNSGGPADLAEIGGKLGQWEALAASDDGLAVNLLFLCYQAGRAPGKDVAVMGQGNERIGLDLSPVLTTIDYNGLEIGQRSLDTVLQRIQQTRMDAPQVTLVSPTLVVRESTPKRK